MTGLCRCGCGRPAAVAQLTRRKLGHVKGEPVPYISGHNPKGQKKGPLSPKWKGERIVAGPGYAMVAASTDADTGRARVYEHRVLAERALRKPLPPRAEVHHVDGDGLNNGKGNIVVCENRAYHMLLHQRQRALEATGYASWRKCPYCKRWGDPSTMNRQRRSGGGERYVHPGCGHRASRPSGGEA